MARSGERMEREWAGRNPALPMLCRDCRSGGRGAAWSRERRRDRPIPLEAGGSRRRTFRRGRRARRSVCWRRWRRCGTSPAVAVALGALAATSDERICATTIAANVRCDVAAPTRVGFDFRNCGSPGYPCERQIHHTSDVATSHAVVRRAAAFREWPQREECCAT